MRRSVREEFSVFLDILLFKGRFEIAEQAFFRECRWECLVI